MSATRNRDVWVLLGLSLVVRLVVAALIVRPGYVDVAYYAAGAVHMADGGGLTDPFVWNYLGDPTDVPHPGFQYWMPLPSLLAAPLAAVFPGSFFALQLPFVLLSAVLPLVAYLLGWKAAGPRVAWLGGLFAVFSGFFFPYWTLPETFAPFALLGSLALWLAGGRGGPSTCVLAGLMAGLAHLTRADGVLLLPAVALGVLLSRPSGGLDPNWRRAAAGGWMRVAIGYVLVMGPWFVRNLVVSGVPLSPAGARALWLRDYDDMFCYGCDLSLSAYAAWGWGSILSSKLWALRVNLERLLAEAGLVFLLPFAAIGLYRQRHRVPYVVVCVYLALVYLLHSLAFTFPGARGGFFHASAPVLPFVFAAGAEGLRAAVAWAGQRRRWKVRQAQVVFAIAAAVLAIALSIYVAVHKLPGWRAADEAYRQVGMWLDDRGVPANAVVMVGNPPAFWYHTHRLAVVVPNGGPEMLWGVGERFGVAYVVLGPNHPRPLAGVYGGDRVAGLQLVATFGDGQVLLFRYEEP